VYSTMQNDDLSFMVDLGHHRIVTTFNIHFKDPRPPRTPVSQGEMKVGAFDRINKYMFQIPFGQLKEIQRMELDEKRFALAISLDSRPQFYRKRLDDVAGHADGNMIWSEFDTWYRQSDVVYDPFQLTTAKVTLHKERPVVDIGMNTTP